MSVPMTTSISLLPSFFSFFFFNDTATTEIYTLSLHDALPISRGARPRKRATVRDRLRRLQPDPAHVARVEAAEAGDRKSTRLNSSHLGISYAVFCLKKKKKRGSPRSTSREFSGSSAK